MGRSREGAPRAVDPARLARVAEAAPETSDVVSGFSLQFELTYTNVLNMLELGGVPLRSADRADGDPLVVAGGPTATHPEPLAPFVDARS